ncbi:glycosyltransferase [Fibrobacter sp. HC4]|uniref:glycosyltransferase n=1 Tax=Fibrobacter sp. HC4 TaxID=3239812 RepID=UPI0020184F48|nr:glycosyltransferase [Fibrobacter succinogenes]MCL4102584.1 hypothetical protein [Fibrobacter succinogenes]MCQ2100822.1 glycosyltransferase [Fibrobacter sp.]
MKKILFDLKACQPIEHIKFHGGGVYGYVVFERLCKIAPERVIAYWDKSRFIDPAIKDLIDNMNVETVDASEKKLIDVIDDRVSLFYTPLYDGEHRSLFSLDLPIYVTVHGLRKLEMNRDSYEIKYATNLKTKFKCILKQTFLYNKLKKKFFNEYATLLRQKNVNVITVSNHSKNSLLFHYPFLSEEKINVFYSPSTTSTDIEKVISYGSDKYYLIISADRWLKNGLRAMEAFDTLFDENRLVNTKVIVVGLSPKQKLMKNIRNKDLFVVKDYVCKDELESLLKGAYALVYPSLNEGFGYPPLEAMKYGTPVIASPFASIPEVCADSVIYANPYSIEEIAMRILYLNNESVYNDYCVRAKNRYNYITHKQDSDLTDMVNLLLGKIE